MEQRISLITLGVDDLDRSTRFFERLGWKRSVRDVEGVAFFQCGGIAISLYPKAQLAVDAGVELGGGCDGHVAIAYNTRRREEVDEVLAEAVAAGGELVKPAQEVFWGGYSGYFRDLDGHLWEVAWNPGFPIGEAGALHLPD